MRTAPDRTRPPPLGTPRPPVVPVVQRAELACGLPVLVVERRALPVVDVRLVLPGGAAADPAGAEGCAALTAASLDEGTERRTGPELAAALALLGAGYRAFADWHETVLSLHVLSPGFDAAIRLFTEIARTPVFPATAVARRRAQRAASLRQDRDDPGITAARVLARAIYGGHRYGTPAAGTPESVESLTQEQLVASHARTFGPRHGFLVVAGDVALPSLIPLLDDAFGNWIGGAAWGSVAPSPTDGSAMVHVVDRPGAPQSELRVGHAGPPRSSPDYFPLIVGNTILGGAFTSRINLVLREQKGLTYGARTGFAFRRDGGPFGASVAIQTDATAEAVGDILDAMEALRVAPPSESELDRARSWLALGLPRGLETAGSVADRVADIESHGLGDDYLARFVERVSAVSGEQVRAAAHRHLQPARTSIALVGDLARIRKPLESLGRAEVRAEHAP